MKTEPCKEYLDKIPFHSEHIWNADIHGIPFGPCLKCGMSIEEWNARTITNFSTPQSETPRAKMDAETERLVDLIEAGLPASESDGMNEFERAAWKLCDRVRTLERELGEANTKAGACEDLWKQGLAHNKQLQQELSQVRGELAHATDWMAGEQFQSDFMSAKEMRTAILGYRQNITNLQQERDLLAKQNHKMREAFRKLLLELSPRSFTTEEEYEAVNKFLKEILLQPDTSRL